MLSVLSDIGQQHIFLLSTHANIEAAKHNLHNSYKQGCPVVCESAMM